MALDQQYVNSTEITMAKIYMKEIERYESTSKRKRTTAARKKKETNDNHKRCTFWADQTQWEWIQNYAYTTRQSIMDTMYEIIEDFQSNHTDFEIESKPRRRNTSTRR